MDDAMTAGEALTERGAYWGMRCFNSMSKEQQRFLVMEGYVPIGQVPAGTCPNPAELEVTTMYDLMPGPRFYCLACAVEHLRTLDVEGEYESLT